MSRQTSLAGFDRAGGAVQGVFLVQLPSSLARVSMMGHELVESGRREDLAAAEEVSLRRWSRYR